MVSRLCTKSSPAPLKQKPESQIFQNPFDPLVRNVPKVMIRIPICTRESSLKLIGIRILIAEAILNSCFFWGRSGKFTRPAVPARESLPPPGSLALIRLFLSIGVHCVGVLVPRPFPAIQHPSPLTGDASRANKDIA